MVADNYAGYTSLQFNPANLADSRFRFNMNVVGFKTHLQNNYVQLETPHSIYEFLHWKWDSTFGTQNFDYPFKESYLTERLNGNDKYVYASGSVNAFCMQFALKDKAGFSFGLTTKAYAKVSNIPEDGLKTFLQDFDTIGNMTTKDHQSRLMGQTINLGKSGASALAYQQYGLKYAFVAHEKKDVQIKVGLGLDYNIGLYGGYYRNNDVEYTLTGIDTLIFHKSDAEIAYINPEYVADPGRRLNDYFGGSRLGRGLGINAGVVYEHRPDAKSYKYKMNRKTYEDLSENKYDWKVAASIVDFGFINFTNGAAARRLKVSDPSKDTAWNNFNDAQYWTNIDNIDTFINTIFDDVERDSSFRMYTPATLNLSADYKIKNNVYVSASYSQSLMRNKGKSVKMPNVLSVSPRYESKWLTVAMPLSFSRYYNVVNWGAYLRGGVFYVGTDNLGGFFTGKKTNGLNLYAGFNWPIHHKKLEDMDGDGISDDEDQCPSMAGTRYTNGCPDADGDKVADDEDECPNDTGSKRTKGCPDSDEDRVADKDDKCPDVFGDKNTAGCPDTDGDGVHDGIDNCPTVAGDQKYKGCIESPEEDLSSSGEKSNNKDKTSNENPSKFDTWDFDTYEYWPVLGAYNDIRWAEELQNRLNIKLRVTTTIKTIPGVSKYYITLGEARTLKEAIVIQKILDIPVVNQELNGTLWWKKVKK
ncbi:DUF5723 family protein [Bacteroidia bacterium]|nr:DUF5723 family protein [Bacteroidia bacterium]